MLAEPGIHHKPSNPPDEVDDRDEEEEARIESVTEDENNVFRSSSMSPMRGWDRMLTVRERSGLHK